MKKKIIIGVIIVLLILVILIFKIPIHSNNAIITKGYIMFGKNYCPKDENDFEYEDFWHESIAGQAFTPYKCKLCNQTYDHSNTAIPRICRSCAEITGRCQQCGKLKK